MEVLPVDARAPDPEPLSRALAVLRSGGLIVYPTDTLYALGGLALDASAAARVLRAKGRPPASPLPVIAADLAQVEALSARRPAALAVLASRFWPGPLTLVLGAVPAVPDEVTAGTGTVAVRVPDLLLARRLCADGPLVSTSANRSGGPPPVTCTEAVAGVGAAAALALDGGPGRAVPSTIVDLTGAPRLVRDGAVPWNEVARVLRAAGS